MHCIELDLILNLFFFICLFAASRIRYEITSGNIGGAFAVKNMTGAIYVAGALDYETRKRVSIFAYYWRYYDFNTFDAASYSLGVFDRIVIIIVIIW